MSDPISPAGQIAIAVEYSLWALGMIILWRVQFSAAARVRQTIPSPLAFWRITPTHFFQMAFCVVACAWGAQFIVSHLSNRVLGEAAVDGDLWQLVLGISLQLGLLAGVAVAFSLPRSIMATPTETPPPSPPCPRPFQAAVATFLIALPVITLLGYAWKGCLQLCGIETPEQDMVDIFRQADSPEKLLLLVGLAVIVAPLTEEIIFRAGLFRYLRTRVPRWVALLVPSAIFAMLHSNAVAFLPLFALGVLFSLAYERTGRISVTIIAHGLFNLHTILLIMAGVTS
jgi:membrane protease YdiL (CAAX protease family)